MQSVWDHLSVNQAFSQRILKLLIFSDFSASFKVKFSFVCKNDKTILIYGAY